MPPAEDELATREVAPRKDAQPLHASLANDHITAHQSVPFSMRTYHS
jgi:hypothetical protein